MYSFSMRKYSDAAEKKKKLDFFLFRYSNYITQKYTTKNISEKKRFPNNFSWKI